MKLGTKIRKGDLVWFNKKLLYYEGYKKDNMFVFTMITENGYAKKLLTYKELMFYGEL